MQYITFIGDSAELTASWTMSGSTDKKGTIDVYLTKDKDVLKKVKTGDNKGDSLGTNILHKQTQK